MLVVVLASLLLLGSLTITLFWALYYQGGFTWTEDPKHQFNLHPVLMVAGFITFSGFCELRTLYSTRESRIISISRDSEIENIS
ncbi:hypothetical protein B7P43_G18163 [Cryptotermes secundus]|uniref:Cytochrome b561 domain-containing protein n=1 Tax=Cryptotermes secundus TaxID=105785 RepID=A0A2J7QDW3_9NEOP|nr:hypothetical protein B7P43_G18163 [Cryptotermes secundus]